jgi:hypothetical protein
LEYANDYYKSLFGHSEVRDFNLDETLWLDSEN